MIDLLLEENLTDKTLLDMGCGTGVLAILADLKKAKKIEAIDIDHWSYQNTIENIKINNCENIYDFEGDVYLINNKTYEVIHSNINRNILLKDITEYEKSMVKNGVLFLSGFYKENIPMIKEKAATVGLEYVTEKTKNNWVALKLIKSCY